MKYECKDCLFYTDLKPNYIRHISTKKHKRNTGCIDIKGIKSSYQDSTKVAQMSTKNMKKTSKKVAQMSTKVAQNEHKFDRM